MTGHGADWPEFFDHLGGFAGTLFALVLAARQIRAPLKPNPASEQARADLVDSVGVTVELGASAAFAALFPTHGTWFFAIAVTVVAAIGLTLSIATSATGVIAWANRTASDRERLGQAIGTILPITCYAAAILWAYLGWPVWAYATATSWLAFSGTTQAVWWYARIWQKKA